MLPVDHTYIKTKLMVKQTSTVFNSFQSIIVTYYYNHTQVCQLCNQICQLEGKPAHTDGTSSTSFECYSGRTAFVHHE